MIVHARASARTEAFGIKVATSSFALLVSLGPAAAAKVQLRIALQAGKGYAHGLHLQHGLHGVVDVQVRHPGRQRGQFHGPEASHSAASSIVGSPSTAAPGLLERSLIAVGLVRSRVVGGVGSVAQRPLPRAGVRRGTSLRGFAIVPGRRRLRWRLPRDVGSKLDGSEHIVEEGLGICTERLSDGDVFGQATWSGEPTFAQEVGNLLLAERPHSRLVAVVLQQRDNVLGEDIRVGVGAANEN